MKIVVKGLALAALAFITAPAVSAQTRGASNLVTYSCQGGQTLSVNYRFNAQGIPTQAQFNANGRNRVLSYDMNRSNDVETYFTDRAGYTLSSEYMDSNNYRGAPVMVMAPNSQILYKSCVARNASAATAPRTRQPVAHNAAHSINYRCQNNRRVTVQYRFDAAGKPVQAMANLQGANRTLNFDRRSSDETGTYFTGAGYRLGAGYLDVHNYGTSDGINIYSPRSELLFKDCAPAN